MITFNVSFVVRPSKVDKKGFAPIEVSLSVNSDRVYINTSRKCKPAQFDSKKGIVKRDADTNNFLNIVRNKLFECQSELLNKDVPVSAQSVKDLYLNKISFKKITLLEMYDKLIESTEKKVNSGILDSTTYNKELVTYNNLKQYMKINYNGVEDLPLSEINYLFVDGFFTFLRETKSHNTTIKDMMRFKRVITLAINNGHITINPFAGYKMSKEVKEVQFLTEDEIKVLEMKNFSSDRLNKVKDVFLFCCYTALAYIDCKQLTMDNIVTDKDGNKWIYKNRQKTNIQAKIPLLPKALKIWEKYGYNLPVLSNQKYNCYLGEIAEICTINKPLHTHIARHSAAVMFLNAGVPIEVVSKILGHTNITQTQHYAKLLDKTIMDAVKKTKLFAA